MRLIFATFCRISWRWTLTMIMTGSWPNLRCSMVSYSKSTASKLKVVCSCAGTSTKWYRKLKLAIGAHPTYGLKNKRPNVRPLLVQSISRVGSGGDTPVCLGLSHPSRLCLWSELCIAKERTSDCTLVWFRCWWDVWSWPCAHWADRHLLYSPSQGAGPW